MTSIYLELLLRLMPALADLLPVLSALGLHAQHQAFTRAKHSSNSTELCIEGTRVHLAVLYAIVVRDRT